MRYEIKGDTLPVVVCYLENGERMITERGSMSWMSPNMKMETTSNGGIGKAFGSAYVAMNSKSVGADLVYAWPTAEIGMMDAKLAAQIMYPDADADTQSAKAAKYKELQSSPNAAAARGYVDAIIEPADTRKYVIGAFEMLFTKRENRPDKKHGTV